MIVMNPEHLNSTTTSVEIRWSELDCRYQNGDITGYKVNYSVSSSTENWVVQTTNQTSFTATSLFPVTSYIFHIAAINHNGTGPFSDAFTYNTTIPDSKLCSHEVLIPECYHMHQSLVGVFIFLRGRVITNNAIVNFSEVGSGNFEALLCYTDLVKCCKLSQTKGDTPLGEWYLPNNRVKVLNRDHTNVGYFRTRGLSVVRLHRNDSGIFPNGIFYCEIPREGDVSQLEHVYIGIYDLEHGNLVADNGYQII